MTTARTQVTSLDEVTTSIASLSDDTVIIDWSAAGETADTNSNLFFRKIGDVVFMAIVGGGFTKVLSDNAHVAGIIPTDYRPGTAGIILPVNVSVDGEYINLYAWIQANGNLDLLYNSALDGIPTNKVISFDFEVHLSWIKTS